MTAHGAPACAQCLGSLSAGSPVPRGRAVPCARAKQRWLAFEPDLASWPQSYLWPGLPSRDPGQEREKRRASASWPSTMQAPTAHAVPALPTPAGQAEGLPPAGQPLAVGASAHLGSRRPRTGMVAGTLGSGYSLPGSLHPASTAASWFLVDRPVAGGNRLIEPDSHSTDAEGGVTGGSDFPLCVSRLLSPREGPWPGACRLCILPFSSPSPCPESTFQG